MDSAMEAAGRAVYDLPMSDGDRCGDWLGMWSGDDAEADALLIAQAAIQAYLTAKEAEGFVLVPVEPTARMVLAGANERENGDMELHARKWRAMLAARPREEDR